jgi:hypothetical protein
VRIKQCHISTSASVTYVRGPRQPRTVSSTRTAAENIAALDLLNFAGFSCTSAVHMTSHTKQTGRETGGMARRFCACGKGVPMASTCRGGMHGSRNGFCDQSWAWSTAAGRYSARMRFLCSTRVHPGRLTAVPCSSAPSPPCSLTTPTAMRPTPPPPPPPRSALLAPAVSPGAQCSCI